MGIKALQFIHGVLFLPIKNHLYMSKEKINFKGDSKMSNTLTFSKVDFDLKPVNSLLPVIGESEEKYIDSNGMMFALYKCKTCGKEQLVLINPDTHKPYGEVKCYNIDCFDYGYSREYTHLQKLNHKITDRIASKQFGVYDKLITVGFIDDTNLLCMTDVTYKIMIINKIISEQFKSYYHLSSSSSLSIRPRT